MTLRHLHNVHEMSWNELDSDIIGRSLESSGAALTPFMCREPLQGGIAGENLASQNWDSIVYPEWKSCQEQGNHGKQAFANVPDKSWVSQPSEGSQSPPAEFQLRDPGIPQKSVAQRSNWDRSTENQYASRLSAILQEEDDARPLGRSSENDRGTGVKEEVNSEASCLLPADDLNTGTTARPRPFLPLGMTPRIPRQRVPQTLPADETWNQSSGGRLAGVDSRFPCERSGDGMETGSMMSDDPDPNWVEHTINNSQKVLDARQARLNELNRLKMTTQSFNSRIEISETKLRAKIL